MLKDLIKPAGAAVAVLLIAGVGAVFAGSPGAHLTGTVAKPAAAPAAPVAPKAAPAAQIPPKAAPLAPRAAGEADGDNIQEGDQSAPDTGATDEASSESDPTTDTDNVQEGDQTSPDAGAATAETVKAAAHRTSTYKVVPSKRASAASETGGETETSGETETPGETENASDGPGGHEDPAGNVDHQFEGEE